MKKLFFLAGLLYASSTFSQATINWRYSYMGSLFNEPDTVAPIDYYQLSKMQLTDIYLKEVVRVTSQLSICAFDTITNSVPTTKYTQNKFKRTREKYDSYSETLIKEFKDIIPYSNKEDLIRAILYLKSLQ